MQTATSAHRKAHGAPSRPQQRRTTVPSLEWLALKIVEQGKDAEMIDLLEILRSGVRTPGGL